MMKHVVCHKMSVLRSCNIAFILIFTAVFAMSLSGCGMGAMKAASVDRLPQNPSGYIYGIPIDDNAAVVAEEAADIYASPDVKSDRITQVLYNQPVSILQKQSGWLKVTTVDGSSGWIKQKHLDADISSIYGGSYTHRIIITSRKKEITSSPTGGITLMNAPMGSEFYAFNSSDDAYEVFLPGKKTGWLRGSGIIHIGLDEVIPVTNAEDFAATALKFKGTGFLLNGLSSMGIDSAGLVYICARINGVNLPRTIEGQMNTGVAVKPEEAQVGDLVFLSGAGEGEGGTASCVGVYIGSGNYVFAGRNTGYVAIGDMNKENVDGRVMAVRRIFN